MEQTAAAAMQASLEVTHKRFLAAIGELRPELHAVWEQAIGVVEW
jgi:hypothetical protein